MALFAAFNGTCEQAQQDEGDLSLYFGLRIAMTSPSCGHFPRKYACDQHSAVAARPLEQQVLRCETETD